MERNQRYPGTWIFIFPPTSYKTNFYNNNNFFLAGDVHSIAAVRGTSRWLLGDRRDDRSRLHLLLHGQDPGRVPVRGGRSVGPENSGPRFLRVHRQGVLRSPGGGQGRQHSSDNRAAHDLHTLRRGVRRSHDRELSRGCHWHSQLDDGMILANNDFFGV